MKAIVCREYGGTNVLKLEEVETPVPSDGEVLVRIHAASMNDFDWGLVSGKPYVVRFFNGFRQPKVRIVGCDVAGRVEAVGRRVTRWAPGDRVFGDLSASRFGGFAEYVCVPETALVRTPDKMTDIDAASLPQAATLVMQGLFDYRPPADGQRILINGAGGGVGTFGVQIAKQWNVEVTCVDRAGKLKTLLALGADHVIDYQLEDFARRGEQYDLIIDAKSSRSPFAIARALAPDGIYATVGGSMFRIAQILACAPFIRRTQNKHLHMVALDANKHLDHAIALYEAGKLKPVLDRIFPLADVPAAMQHLVDADHTGKVMIDVTSHTG